MVYILQCILAYKTLLSSFVDNDTDDDYDDEVVMK